MDAVNRADSYQLLSELARRVYLEVNIAGKDVSSFVESYLTSFEYSSKASGKSDEIQMELHDRDAKWLLGGWMPAKGSAIRAAIRCLNWSGNGYQNMALKCGGFKCDEAEYKGPAGRISIKAVSASLQGPLRDTQRSQGWENFSLQDVAGDIAQRNNLELYYDADTHNFERQDQRGEADLSFLERLASERGVNLKVHDNKLVLYGARRADEKPGVITIPRLGSQFSPSEFSFKSKSQSTSYQACIVEYNDPSSGELHSYTYNPGGATLTDDNVRKVYTLDGRVESEAGAMEMAKNSLRGGNEGEDESSITIMGHPGLVAGVTIELAGFGPQFSGRYFVKEASHKLGPYTTSAKLRRTLEY